MPVPYDHRETKGAPVSDSTPGLPPAGWYPDPAGGPTRRWWDGAHWTERIEAPTGTIDPALAVPADPVATPGTSPNTWAMWVVGLTPILSIIGVLVIDFEGYFRRVFEAVIVSQNPGASADIDVFGIIGPTFAIGELFMFLSLAAFIVFAALDYRILRSRGVDRPFHWAWAFFTLLNPGSLVYLIGRTVVAHRRTGRSASAPMWVGIGLMVVTIIVVFAKLIIAFGALGPLLQQYSDSISG
jgi:hypothetical protein